MVPPPNPNWRARFGWVLVVLMACVAIGGDWLRRRDQLAHFSQGELAVYALACSVSFIFWAALGALATSRSLKRSVPAQLFLALAGAVTLGAQAYSFARYRAYMDPQSVLVGTAMLPSIRQQLWLDRVTFLGAVFPPLVIGIAAPMLARRWVLVPERLERIALDAGLISFLVVLFFPSAMGAEQGSPPDVLYLSAMGALARTEWNGTGKPRELTPGPRSPLPVPALKAARARKANVVMIVTESVRGTSVCTAYDPACKFTPFSNEAAPRRFGFEQMRSLDSTTAISLAVLWSGLSPDMPRKALHEAPLIWEYARAGGWTTAYFTSQNLLFGNSGTWLESVPLTARLSGTEIEPDATYEVGADDHALVGAALARIEGLPEPFFTVVHLSNTHFPYKVDDLSWPNLSIDDAPGDFDRDLWLRYQGAIYLQDKAVATLIQSIRKSPRGDHTSLFFISDHGEQLREKGAVGHTGTLFDEEIHVPAWLDTPPGLLSREEETALRSLRQVPLTQLDVLPTLLDLLGVADAPELAAFQAVTVGRSLLRGGSRDPRFLTNCTELWTCAFKNWGAMGGSKKLIAHQGDHAWNCYDIARDPREEHDLGPEACGDLVGLAESKGHGAPYRPDRVLPE